MVWHNPDHYGQMALYLGENNFVPPPAARHPPNSA
jgi:hypothetical protein